MSKVFVYSFCRLTTPPFKKQIWQQESTDDLQYVTRSTSCAIALASLFMINANLSIIQQKFTLLLKAFQVLP